MQKEKGDNLNTKLSNLFKSILEPGEKKIESVMFGFYIGLFPMLGFTALLGFLTSMVFRLNHYFVQGMTLVMTPLHLLLWYPFLKAGRFLFFNDKNVIPAISFKEWFTVNDWHVFHYLLDTVVGGIGLWGIFCLVTFPFLYRFLARIM